MILVRLVESASDELADDLGMGRINITTARSRSGTEIANDDKPGHRKDGNHEDLL